VNLLFDPIKLNNVNEYFRHYSRGNVHSLLTIIRCFYPTRRPKTHRFEIKHISLFFACSKDNNSILYICAQILTEFSLLINRTKKLLFLSYWADVFMLSSRPVCFISKRCVVFFYVVSSVALNLLYCCSMFSDLFISLLL